MNSSFWVDPRGKVIDLGTRLHIDEIISKPEKFDLSKDLVLDTFAKYGEQVGSEGNAREELINAVIKKGFVRIRMYRNFWSITLDNWRKTNTKKKVAKWAEAVSSKRGVDLFAPAKILDIGLNSLKSYTIKELKFAEVLEGVDIVAIEEYDGFYIPKKPLLGEAVLSKVWKMSQEHDIGTITAFRYATECGKGKVYTRKENLTRNAELLKALRKRGYSVTAVKGKYIENYGSANAKEVGENVFLVVDLYDQGTLEKDLRQLGLKYDQDSILFMPRSSKGGELISTNKCPEGYPGFGKLGVKVKLQKTLWGQSGEFFTTVRGRPFTLK